MAFLGNPFLKKGFPKPFPKNFFYGRVGLVCYPSQRERDGGVSQQSYGIIFTKYHNNKSDCVLVQSDLFQFIEF